MKARLEKIIMMVFLVLIVIALFAACFVAKCIDILMYAGFTAGAVVLFILNYLELKKESANRYTKLLTEGEESFKKNQPKSALRVFEQALRLRPQSYEAIIGIAQSHRLMRDTKKAEETFRKAIELSPERYEGHFFLGINYLHQNKARESIVALKAAQRLKPDHAEIYYFLGKVQEKINDNADALDSFRKHLELKPDSKYREEIEERVRDLEQHSRKGQEQS